MKDYISIVEELDISFSLKSAIYCIIASTKNEHAGLFLSQAKEFIDYNIDKCSTTEKKTENKAEDKTEEPPVKINVESKVDKEIKELADKIFDKPTKKSSENKEKVISMFYQGIPKDEIAAKLGLAPSTVSKYVRQDLADDKYD